MTAPQGGMVRLAPMLVIVGVLGFVVCEGIAMSRYPEPTGYRFFREYWCDLFDGVTASGRHNPGSWWAVSGVMVLGLGALPLLGLRRRRLRPSLVGCALLGCLALVLVPFVTALGLLDLHRLLILVAGPPGLVGWVAMVVRDPHPGARRLGWTFLALAAWNFVQYARQELFAAPWAGLPVVQKAATAALLVWMLVSAWMEREAGTRRVM